MLKRTGWKSDEMSTKHSEQLLLRNQWKNDVTALQDVIKKLADSYSSHKGDFALGRYEKLKEMIKNAVQEYDAITCNGNPRPLSSDDACAETEAKESTKGGLLGKLRASAKHFSIKASSGNKDSDKSNTSVAEDTDKLRKETIHLKHEFRTERDKLKQLSDKYKESKKYNPTQRYPLLKDMIKQMSRT